MPTVISAMERHPSRHRFFAESPVKPRDDSAEREAIKKDALGDPKEAESMWIRDITDKKVTKYVYPGATIQR